MRSDPDLLGDAFQWVRSNDRALPPTPALVFTIQCYGVAFSQAVSCFRNVLKTRGNAHKISLEHQQECVLLQFLGTGFYSFLCSAGVFVAFLSEMTMSLTNFWEQITTLSSLKKQIFF